MNDLELSNQGKNLIYAVIGGLVAGTVFLFVTVDGMSLTALLLQKNSDVLKGWIWQLVTSIFIAPPFTLGLIDVAFNAMALAWLDGMFSFTYSRKQYYAVFLATGIAGNVFSLANGPGVGSFGASGGIFGLLAGVISFDIVTNRRLSISLVVWFVGIFAISSFTSAYVDWVAHAGGALLGLVLGYAVGVRSRRDSE